MRKVINRSHTPLPGMEENPAGPWPAPAGSDQEDPLDTCIGTHFRGHGTMQIFQPELLENIFGAKPPKRHHPEISCHDPTFSKRFQAGSVPRDSMRATKLSRGKAAMGGFQRRRPPPALSGRGGFLASARFPRVTAAVAKCVVFLPKETAFQNF